MNLLLKRTWPGTGCTIGELLIDGAHECYVCEDTVREVDGMPVGSWKIPGQTAIPRGRYEVRLTPSARFKRIMPQVMDVPGFEGIRIHSGNTAEDTEGCLLVGKAKTESSLLTSREEFTALYGKLESALAVGEVWITIS